MTDPRIYLVRHGQSEANLDQTVNARLPDHRVELSPEGHRQAEYLAEALPREAPIRILCCICSGQQVALKRPSATPPEGLLTEMPRKRVGVVQDSRV